MVPYRIVLANHHMPLRECLKRILGEKSDLEVIGEAENGSELLNLLRLSQIGSPDGHSGPLHAEFPRNRYDP